MNAVIITFGICVLFTVAVFAIYVRKRWSTVIGLIAEASGKTYKEAKRTFFNELRKQFSESLNRSSSKKA
jgi:hypothetical protein